MYLQKILHVWNNPQHFFTDVNHDLFYIHKEDLWTETKIELFEHDPCPDL